jgi:D-amino-acid oxidase
MVINFCNVTKVYKFYYSEHFFISLFSPFERLTSRNMKKIVIIGGGVIGLSSAVKIAEYYYRKSVQVTLIAETVSPETTGDISAGLWGPYLIGSTPEQKIVDWSKSSHDFFHKLWCAGMAEEAGITMIPIFRLTTDSQDLDPCWKNVVFGYKNLKPSELQKLGNEHKLKYAAGNHFVTFCCEPTKFLPYLMKRFLAAGGRFEKRKVLSLDEFNDFDLIVNCTGLNSKELTNDTELKPIRGQIARIYAPWVIFLVKIKLLHLYQLLFHRFLKQFFMRMTLEIILFPTLKMLYLVELIK